MKKTGKRDEKGSALLLTLGILSLALILGMSFAFSARTSRQVAKVNADQVKAKLLAESCRERVLASFMYTCDYVDNLYPAMANIMNMSKSISNSDSVIHYGVSENLFGPDKSEEAVNSFANVLLNNSNLANYINSIGSLSLGNAGFQTIEDSDDKVIGRVGFVIMEESSKVDINRILTLRQGSKNMPFVVAGESKTNSMLSKSIDIDKDYYYPITASYYSATYDAAAFAAAIDESNTIRVGVHPMEIKAPVAYLNNLKNGFPANSLGEGIDNAATSIQWFSYDHLRNVIGTDFNDDFFKYTFFSLEEPEAYTLDGTAGATKYSRFDITGYELGDHSSVSFYDTDKYPVQDNAACIWPSSSDVEDVSNFMDDILGSADEFPTSQKAIPWLSQMKDRDGNDVKEQVVANMIDFCDKDSFPTRPWKSDKSAYEDQYTDKLFSISGNQFEIPDADVTEPAFWGNEKVAYINEIFLRFVVLREPADAENKTYGYKVAWTPQLELANVFADNVDKPKHIKIRLCGTLSIKNHGETVERFNFPNINGAEKLTTEFTSIDDLSDGYGVCWHSDGMSYSIKFITPDSRDYDFIDPYKNTVPNPTPENPDAVEYLPGGLDVDLNITKIVVMTQDASNEALDYAFIEKNFNAHFEIPELTDLTQIADREWYRLYEISLECADSRFNHKTSGWFDRTTGSLIDPPGGISSNFSEMVDHGGSLDDFNADAYNDKIGSLTADTDYDKEENADSSIKYSTAFIKDAPFDTLWELGCIHRGEPFRTINLKKYIAMDDADTDKGKYTLGDAAILDQVKIGPAKYGYKYNVNSQNEGVLKNVILDKIDKDNDYESPSDSGSFSGTLSFTGFTPSTSRAAFANCLTGTFNKDREAEAYIGRAANLLGTRYDAFTLFIVAQPMSEIEDATAGTWDALKDTIVNPTKYTNGGSEKYCSILGTQVIVVQFVRDTWTNKFTVLHKHYTNND